MRPLELCQNLELASAPDDLGHIRIEQRQAFLQHLVVDIGDVHDKLDVIAEVINQNPPDNILGHVISGILVSQPSAGSWMHSPRMAKMSGVVDCRSAVVPFHSLAVHGLKLNL